MDARSTYPLQISGLKQNFIACKEKKKELQVQVNIMVSLSNF